MPTGQKITTSYGTPVKWEEETDIIVIGSGLAGLSAAAEAALLGARALILEKMPYCGGNSLIAGGGYCCWDSKLKLREKLGLGEDSLESHMEDTLRGGDYFNDVELVKLLVREAPFGLNWLADAGVEFEDTLPRIGGHSAHRSYQVKRGSGREMVEALRKLALKRGAELRLNATITALWRENSKDRILGVRVNFGSETQNIRALKGVVLASGGFSRDIEMRLSNQPRLAEAYNCTNHKGATGEVIRYAKAVGAETIHMAFVQLYPCAAPANGGMDKFAFDCYSGAGYGLIYVNQDGERFVNELGRRDEVSDAQVRRHNKPTWSILNRAIFQKLARTESAIQKGVESGRLLEAGSIADLAKKSGVPAAKLEETVLRHNDAVASGSDPLFHKSMSSQMLALDEGPFYAIAQWPAIHFCMGGLKINARSNVLDIWGDEIPGLYAAGEVCGGIHGANRLGGNALAECVVFGRRAGKAAAGARDLSPTSGGNV
jgi:fumarate reductase flavoprotein subunit